ncbi:MAG: hypothetical protein QXL18_04365 [Candidatus Woesearchaeota archaeon]
MNKLYQKLYAQKLFTYHEANKVIKNKQVCKNTLNRLIKKGYIKRIRKNIYQIVPLDNKEFQADEIHIATKINPEIIICCNTALKVLGFYKDESKIIYLYYKNPAKIKIEKTIYKLLKNNQSFGIIKTNYQTPYNNIEINITNIERTIIDCIKTRSITLQELINILKNTKIQIDVSKIISYLDKYKKPILYNKTGLILDITKQYLKIENEELEKIRKKLSKKIYYAKEKGLKLIKPKYKYYIKWNIMIPEELYTQTNLN